MDADFHRIHPRASAVSFLFLSLMHRVSRRRLEWINKSAGAWYVFCGRDAATALGATIHTNDFTHAKQEGWLPVKTRDIVQAWGKILAGKTPSLSIEITRECPLSCPGCYAYGDEHLGGGLLLKQVRDHRGQELVDGILRLVDEYEPLHVSLVGGEPLVRHK